MSSNLAQDNPGPTSWSDYQRWDDDQRWEIIAGVAYAMTPAPSTSHQSVVVRLGSRLERALAGGPCRPFIAPTDVRLSETDVVQPDLLAICDPQRITPGHIKGAPDLVIEVLSPHTATRDLRQKKALYERHGVAEYVVADPLELYAIRFTLGAEGYDRGTVVGSDETLRLAVGGGIEIALREVFEVAGPGEKAMDPGGKES